jgi:hypothetical protein
MLRLISSFLALSSLLITGAPPKTTATAEGSNRTIVVTARVVTDKADVASEIGVDPGFQVVVVDVRVRPLDDSTKIRVDRDDFTLVSARDGQRSQPLEPGQLAGKGALVLSSTGTGSVRSENMRGPVWGGIGGGAPGRIGNQSPGFGNSTVSEQKVEAKDVKGTATQDSPLMVALKDKILPNTPETTEASQGLLYFLFDGKTPRPKDLTLIHKGAGGGRIIIEFERK